MSEKKDTQKQTETDEIILLEDLQPRKDVRGGGRRLLFGQQREEKERLEEEREESE